MGKYREQILQEFCSDWLARSPLLYCASAGGMRTSIRTAIKMKQAGYKKGFPDIFIYEPRGGFYGLAIEIKSGSRPSIEQVEWARELEARGYKAKIMPTGLDFDKALEWFKQIVTDYLKGDLK